MDGSVGGGVIVTGFSCVDFAGMERGGDYYVSFWHKEHRM